MIEVAVSDAMSVSAGAVQVSVVIPVYNERATLDSLLKRLAGTLETIVPGSWEILVVDDGSTDMPVSMSSIQGIRLLRHSRRSGSGAARKTGTRAAAGERVAWIDGDGTYPVEALAEVIVALGNADQVIGARSTDHGYLKRLRLAVKNTTARIAGLLWRTPIPDLNSGLRVFRRASMAAWLDELPDGFSCTTTATLAALNHRQQVRFVPIAYGARRMESQSKFHPVWDTLRLWRVVWRCWLRR